MRKGVQKKADLVWLSFCVVHTILRRFVNTLIVEILFGRRWKNTFLRPSQGSWLQPQIRVFAYATLLRTFFYTTLAYETSTLAVRNIYLDDSWGAHIPKPSGSA